MSLVATRHPRFVQDVSPPPVVNDTWTDYSPTINVNTGGEFFGHEMLFEDSGKILLTARDYSGSGPKTVVYDPANRGAVQSISPTNWTIATLNTENYSIIHDPVQHRIFVGGQSPSRIDPTHQGQSLYMADTDPGGVNITLFRHFPSECQIGIAQRLLIAVGGFSIDGSSIAISDCDNLANITTIAAGGDIPPTAVANTGGTCWQYQSTIDRRTGQIYLVTAQANGGSTPTLYICNNVLETYRGQTAQATWVKMPTFGTPPTSIAGSYSFDYTANAIVVYVGINDLTTAGGYGGQTLRTTWVLPLSTLVWRIGPSLAGGQLVPKAVASSFMSMFWDPVRLWNWLSICDTDGVPWQLWALQIAGPTL